jgi:hypothetical protein
MRFNLSGSGGDPCLLNSQLKQELTINLGFAEKAIHLRYYEFVLALPPKPEGQGFGVHAYGVA